MDILKRALSTPPAFTGATKRERKSWHWAEMCEAGLKCQLKVVGFPSRGRHTRTRPLDSCSACNLETGEAHQSSTHCDNHSL